MTDDDDPGEAFDRAAARGERAGQAGVHHAFGPDRSSWRRRHRLRSLRRATFVLLLLPAHIVATGQVSGLLVAHLVVLAIVGTQAVTAWLESRREFAT